MTISRFIGLLSLLMLIAPLAFAGGIGADRHDDVATAMFMFISMPLLLLSMGLAVTDCVKKNEAFLAFACVLLWPITYYVLLRSPPVPKAG